MNLQAQLSKRESQMITGIVLGKVKKEIASELIVSVRTVESTIRNAMTKVEVKKSTDLVTYWFLKRFSIPLESLPTSITAMVFLLIWIPFEFSTHTETLRSTRSRRAGTEETREREGRRTDEFTIEF